MTETSELRVTTFNAGKVTHRHDRDNGGMFPSVCGVAEWEGKFHAFVGTGWGGGIRGPAKATEAEALADIERIYDLEFG